MFVKIKALGFGCLISVFFIISSVVFWGNLFLLRELRVLTEQSPFIYIYTYNIIHDPVRITARLEDSPICIIKTMCQN